jgi:glycosyltransferase involved in cell wall biosynthesis
MDKLILIEPLWKLRGEYRNWHIDGYDFVIQDSMQQGLVRNIARTDMAYRLQHALGKHIPVNLAKPWLERNKKLEAVDLTYAVMHCVYRNEPWVLDMKTEQPHLLAGSERMFARYKDKVGRLLQSDNCRAVICELEAEKLAMLQCFPEIKDKLKVVHSTVPAKKFVKDYGNPTVKLLFVNSANINAGYHFYAHGGRILLDAFKMLRKQNANVELVIRSGVPPHIKSEILANPAITLYDEVIPWDILEKEFQTADIFVYPTHVTPSTIFLDAMSYELPIVTTRVWGNMEIVKGGVTGLTVGHPKADGFTDGFIAHFDSDDFKRVVMGRDYELSKSVAEKVAQLVEDAELRQMLGKAGRCEIEHGGFSYRNWGKSLKEVLDGALGIS